MTDPGRPADTPLRRVRKTRRSVLVVNRIAGGVIRGGGVLVIFAVLGICLFLALVVLPLFRGADLGPPAALRLPAAPADAPWLDLVLHEHGRVGAVFAADGTLAVFATADGAELRREDWIPSPERRALVHSFDGATGALALGLDDGSLLLGALRSEEQFFAEDAIPAEAAALPVGGVAPFRGGVIERLTTDRARWSGWRTEMRPPVATSGEGPLRALAYRALAGAEVLASLRGEDHLSFSEVSVTENMLTGEVESDLREVRVPYEARGRAPPRWLLLPSSGDQLLTAWEDGAIERWDLRQRDSARLAESVDLAPGAAQLTALTFLIGDQALLAGHDDGSVDVWFRIEAEPAASGASPAPHDGFRLARARQLQPQAAGITAIAVSARNKTFVTAAADGSTWVRHNTTARVLGEAQAAAAPALLAMAPKGDAAMAVAADAGATRWTLDNPHPETTFASILQPVWYEGYPAPAHTWQSSSGTDDFEPKLGLVPLIFGTLKATLYAMLFSVPIALLAAVYTSEFMSRRMRAIVKPKIEMMASLPSVVLGFLAALVLAPWVENWVLAVLTVFLTVPLAIVFGAYAWLFLPTRLAARFGGWHKFAAIALVAGLAAWAAFPLGAWVERVFFDGDFRAWLAPPHPGNGTPVWWMVLLPLMLLLVVGVHHFWIAPRIAHVERRGGREAWRELGRGAAFLGAAALLALIVAQTLTWAGLDPRDLFLGTYVQRNSLIVGFVMGFAVIPIIYTVTEDALSSVPDHLRGAALGCGATPWQTAARVVVPVAASGIFSAIMIGLGRAVGETMIVVMAAGNTPILDANPFNGLRSLSATIAVELPEAAVEGTLYRMLFLAALTLFLITFVVNTLAEVVRQRFRKRAFEL